MFGMGRECGKVRDRGSERGGELLFTSMIRQ